MGGVVGGVEAFHAATNGDSGGDGNGLSILAASEKQAIEKILRKHNWNRMEAAVELGVSRITLWRKMKKLGISSHPH